MQYPAILSQFIRCQRILRSSNKGFTLLELLLGLIITSVVLGFAMKAIVETNTSFQKDKQDLMVSQTNLTLLQIIGDNIKSAGENIGEVKFPAIEISANTDSDAMTGSSKLTIRRAVVPALETCNAINSMASNSIFNFFGLISPVYASSTSTIDLIGDSSSLINCNQPISKAITNNFPSAVTRSSKLTNARKYRCSQDNISVDYSVLNTDFCEGNSNETALGFITDKDGNYRTFEYIGDVINNYGAEFNESLTANDLSTSFPNTGAIYSAKSSIYIIQERTYTLANTGIISVEYDRSSVKLPLMDKVRQFKVAAKVYSNKETQAIDPVDGVAGLPIARRCLNTVPTYICAFNTGSIAGVPNQDDWKTLAGVKVEISAAFDSRGQNATPTAADLSKLESASEFFPRNVLSR